MTIISYAQNYEDVMLWRALNHIQDGFYIDIGAAWPTYDSVTKLFYDHGWRGLNIEPNPKLFSQLAEERPRDINLCLAVSDHSGRQFMNYLSNEGLSTLDDKIALKHIEEGFQCDRQEVEVTTLSEIWDLNVPKGQEVHFLKIDVEGLEKFVLQGNQWSLHRPWIVLVESTLPLSQTESYQEWEAILLSEDYLFVYADGLNRFYIAREHLDLQALFNYPPNFFDDYIQYSHKQSLDKITHIQSQLSGIGIEIDAQANLQNLEKFDQQKSVEFLSMLPETLDQLKNELMSETSKVKESILTSTEESFRDSKVSANQMKEEITQEINVTKEIIGQVREELSNQAVATEGFYRDSKLSANQMKDEITQEINATKEIIGQVREDFSNQIVTYKDAHENLKTDLIDEITKLKADVQHSNQEIVENVNHFRSTTETVINELNSNTQSIKGLEAKVKNIISEQEVRDLMVSTKSDICNDINTLKSETAVLKDELIQTINVTQDKFSQEINEVKWLTATLREEMSISKNIAIQIQEELCRDINVVRTAHEQQKQELQNVYQSLSWKLTTPLREGNRLIQALQSHKKKHDKKVGFITPWNTKCGIATYGQFLMQDFAMNHIILAPKSENIVTADKENVIRCWKYEEPLSELEETIDRENIDSLVINFHESFFDYNFLSSFLTNQFRANRPVIIIFHKTGLAMPHKQLELIADQLAHCGKLLVHGQQSIEKLSAMGLTNIELFPHGILEYDSSPSEHIRSEQFIVSSYGFFRPLKGLLELVDAVNILIKQGLHIRLELINAEYPDEQSKQLIRECHEKIKEYGIEEHVGVCTDFLSDQESLERLSKTDLIMYPYRSSEESASGAVRYGIAAGRPVAVTPLEIFNDVKEAALVLNGFTPEEMANDIKQLMHDIKTDAPRIRSKRKDSLKWRNNHRFSAVSKKLARIIHQLEKHKVNKISIFRLNVLSLKYWLNPDVAKSLKSPVRFGLVKSMIFVMRRPLLRNKGKLILNKFPRLRERLKAMYSRRGSISSVIKAAPARPDFCNKNLEADLSGLTSSGRIVYDQLKETMLRMKGVN
jgi:FkbM family methyltransferase